MGKKTRTSVEFQGTSEQESRLREVLAQHKGQEGALMPVLQKAQDIYGYLPIEVQRIIAEELGLSLEEVYGVVTFYTQFSLNPKGKYRIGICMGTACYVKGAGDILSRAKSILGIDIGGCTPDRLFSLEDCRCLGCCGLAPVMMVNEDVYGKLSPDDIQGIIDKYRKQG